MIQFNLVSLILSVVMFSVHAHVYVTQIQLIPFDPQACSGNITHITHT